MSADLSFIFISSITYLRPGANQSQTQREMNNLFYSFFHLAERPLAVGIIK
jgi:hypothetical protein